MILNQSAIEYISKELDLPYSGLEQDWDIEMANHKRINEFILVYSNRKKNYSENDKIAFMALIIASFNDMLSDKCIEVSARGVWQEIRLLMEDDLNLFIDIISDWALLNETGSRNLFLVTPYAREILKSFDGGGSTSK